MKDLVLCSQFFQDHFKEAFVFSWYYIYHMLLNEKRSDPLVPRQSDGNRWTVTDKSNNGVLLIAKIKGFSLFSLLANLPSRFQLLDQHGRLQSSWRENWVWPSWNQTTDLLEHTLFQDLSGYEDRPSDQLHCHQQTSQLLVLADCWWTLPLNLTGSKHVEVADWFPSFTANQL